MLASAAERLAARRKMVGFWESGRRTGGDKKERQEDCEKEKVNKRRRGSLAESATRSATPATTRRTS